MAGPNDFHRWRGLHKVCTIEGCEERVRARGWCTSHYDRWREHGDPLGGDPHEAPVERTCASCDQVFTVHAAELRRGGGLYCSRACHAAGARTVRTRTCERCGIEFRPLTNARTRRYCSRPCYDAMVRERERKIIVRTCPICGTEFTRPRSWGKAVYCSVSCKHEGLRRPGSAAYRGRGWSKIAEAIRVRDGRRCRRCGVAEGERQRLHVDHVVPWLTLKDWPEIANRPENLAALCDSCHGVKTTKVEPRLRKGDFLALQEFYDAAVMADAMHTVALAGGAHVVLRD